MGIFSNIFKTLSPGIALKRAEKQLQLEETEVKLDLLRARRGMIGGIIPGHVMGQTNSGYSHGGASRHKSWAKKYNSSSLSPESDIEENRKILRERSRDLCMNTPLGAAAVASTRTNCIGPGLVPKPKIDYEFLGISREEAKKLEKQIKIEFALWAETTLCDNNDQNNFYELQQIAFSDWLKNGEEFALVKYDKELPDMPYRLRIKLTEADRICTPGSLDGSYDGFDTMKKNGNRIMNGIEIDKSGKVVAYHICSQFPGDYSGGVYKWHRIEKRGKKTGNPNILHIFNGERAGQYRGVPFLAPVIQALKQLTRYTEAEIMAAVINSMFSIFIQTENGEGITDFKGADEDGTGEDNAMADDEVEFGYGTVNFLKTGEEVKTVESAHPSSGYDAFAFTMASHIGAALEIAPEVLLKKFTNNFSASRGALNETWKSFRMRRKWFINDFCQEIYILWFNEAVSTGRINAPGYFNNVLIKKAYTNATWNGPAQGMLNPVQEVTAAADRISGGLSTHEDECIAMNGSDFDDNIRTLRNENAALAEIKAFADINENGGNNGKKINVKGIIVPNDDAWIYKWLEMDCCCPKDIEAGLNGAAGEDVFIEINSCGGACAAAFEIYTALKQYQGKITANVIVACSAATIIACGADKTCASRASVFMIHNSQSGASGDYRDLQMEADALREINESIINVYEDKTGLPRKEIQNLMDNDTYMSPKKAVEKGFIDEMMPGMEAGNETENETGNKDVINAVACIQSSFAKGIFNSFSNAIPADKAAMLKEVIMTSSNINKKEEGERKMDLENAIKEHPELKEELEAMLKEAENKGVASERKRLEELDAISASVAKEALDNAKYGEKPLDAKEFAYQAMLGDKMKMSAYMADAITDADESGVNDTGIMPEGEETVNEADELAGYANQKRGVIKK